jgi:hypothetical protein
MFFGSYAERTAMVERSLAVGLMKWATLRVLGTRRGGLKETQEKESNETQIYHRYTELGRIEKRKTAHTAD